MSFQSSGTFLAGITIEQASISAPGDAVSVNSLAVSELSTRWWRTTGYLEVNEGDVHLLTARVSSSFFAPEHPFSTRHAPHISERGTRRPWPRRGSNRSRPP